MDFLRYLPADLRKVECTVTGSCPATAGVDHTRSQIPPWRHKTGSSFPGWCSVSNTRFLDDIRLSEAGPVEFRRGGTKPEVVFRSGSRCCRRVFQVALDHPRLAQSSETSSTAPEYYFRFAAATLDFRPNRLAEPPRVPISRGTPPAHRQLPRHRWRTLRSSALKRGRNGLFLLHPTFHNAPSS